MPELSYDYSIVAGDTPIAGRVEGNFQKIATLLNSTKLDSTNIQNLAIITALINDGAVTADKLSAAVRDAIGLNSSGTVHRGKSIIATAGTTSSTSFGDLSNGPDQVTSVVVPANAILHIRFHAFGHLTGANNGQAAIFLDSGGGPVQHTVPFGGNAAPQTQAARVSATAFSHILSCPVGLVGGGATSDASDVTTGQALGIVQDFGAGIGYTMRLGSTTVTAPANGSTGGACEIRNLAAGTYTVAVKFKVEAADTFTVKNRDLYVAVESF